MTPRRRHLLSLTGALALTGPWRDAQADRPIRLLVIDGISNHDWPRRLALVKEILTRDGSFELEVSTTPAAAADRDTWSRWRPDFTRYDVVLSAYNNLGGKPAWPLEVQRAFEAFVRAGGGFYAYHEANNAFADWPEYNEMIGLGWRDKIFGKALVVGDDESVLVVPPGEGDDTWHADRTDVLVHQLGHHPIHAGLPRTWRAADLEIYRYPRGPARNLDVLAYGHDGVDQKRFPVEWTVQYGQGRVFVSSYGHLWFGQEAPPSMRCAAFQTIMVRALKWLARRDPGWAVPADFPGPDAVSLRPF